MSTVGPGERAGLQAERTDLAWARTALSFLVNGGLLLMHHQTMGPNRAGMLATALAAALLVFAYYMSRRRRRVLEIRPLPDKLDDPFGPLLLAGGTAMLGLLVVWVLIMT